MRSNAPKFAVDAMLGRLARWLRILGYDTLYRNDYSDNELLRDTVRDGRILLSRDRELIGLAGEKGYFVASTAIKKQLADVVGHFELNKEPVIAVCPDCNGNVEEVRKESVEGDVPRYTYLTHTHFYRCVLCGRVYWRGSHLPLAKAFLGSIFNSDET